MIEPIGMISVGDASVPKCLILGAGRSGTCLRIYVGSAGIKREYVTLDFNTGAKPDIVADLDVLPYSWAKDEEYDEIHAYEILEHTGRQGDWRFFFAQFSEFYRILKPFGHLIVTVPACDSMWAWGDPGHTRVISAASLTYLTQENYKKQVGITTMCDYRFVYSANFVKIWENTKAPLAARPWWQFWAKRKIVPYEERYKFVLRKE